MSYTNHIMKSHMPGCTSSLLERLLTENNTYKFRILKTLVINEY